LGEGKRPGLNPLSVPWGQKPKVEEKAKVPSFLGLRNEAVRDNANAEKFVTVGVRGIKGAADGEYRLEWVEGTTLKQYLTQLKLVSTAMRSAVRDLTNPEAGRLRMHYIPEAGAKITLGSPSLSSALQFQRSSHDAEAVALRMGGGAKFVDVPLPKR
jgi:hypothetical protein